MLLQVLNTRHQGVCKIRGCLPVDMDILQQGCLYQTFRVVQPACVFVMAIAYKQSRSVLCPSGGLDWWGVRSCVTMLCWVGEWGRLDRFGGKDGQCGYREVFVVHWNSFCGTEGLELCCRDGLVRDTKSQGRLRCKAAADLENEPTTTRDIRIDQI